MPRILHLVDAARTVLIVRKHIATFPDLIISYEAKELARGEASMFTL